ncbi:MULTISPECIES: hypothetical protein [Photobacterium]|uniref:Uncharacterized protein n=1 Tax=Photobacterium sanguinicancri TaxID=875932 RepID=A0AAW7YE04_9GAMM|nr:MULTISPECIES: hypothetical protein [Photobacterium]MDO6500267.1 hypothetical protein [Photobacterium sanguinicancri]MDO6544984.1 hypothetical protein [Photobacterium sanguinicancri]
MLESLLSVSVAMPAVSDLAAGGINHFAAGVLALIAAVNMFSN